MKLVQSVLTRIWLILVRLWQFWMRDIGKRQGCVGKGLSIGIGLFVILCACSIFIGILRNTGEAVGLLSTRTPSPTATATAEPTETPVPTATTPPTVTSIPTATTPPTVTPTPAPTNTPAPPTNTPVPSTPPPSPTNTPEAVTWIPGLLSGDIKVNLEEQWQLSCEGPITDLTGGVQWSCTRSRNDIGVEYIVDFFGVDPTRIEGVSAKVIQQGTSNIDEAASAFLGFVATLPYDGADPERAQAWVQNNIASGGETTIGSVKFDLHATATARILEIYSVNAE